MKEMALERGRMEAMSMGVQKWEGVFQDRGASEVQKGDKNEWGVCTGPKKASLVQNRVSV